MSTTDRTATIRRDGETVATVHESEVLGWFHRNQSASMHHAIAHEGYSVEYASGGFQSIREGRDAYAAVDPRPSRFANDGRDYRAWAERADAWAAASKGDTDAAANLPMSEWAEARRELMTPQTIAANHALHAQDTEDQA